MINSIRTLPHQHPSTQHASQTQDAHPNTLPKPRPRQRDQPTHSPFLLLPILPNPLLPLHLPRPQHLIPPNLPLVPLPLHLPLLPLQPLHPLLITPQQIRLRDLLHAPSFRLRGSKSPVRVRFLALLLQQAVFGAGFGARGEFVKTFGLGMAVEAAEGAEVGVLAGGVFCGEFCEGGVRCCSG